jgi:hypothetical protein
VARTRADGYQRVLAELERLAGGRSPKPPWFIPRRRARRALGRTGLPFEKLSGDFS